MPATYQPPKMRRTTNKKLGFTVPQQVLYRPLVKAAWAVFCQDNGNDPKDKVQYDVWYRAHLEVSTGKTTTAHCNRTSDFEDAMSHFEAAGRAGIKWQLRAKGGALRRARHGLRTFCQEHQVEDYYVAGIAEQMCKEPNLERLEPPQITNILIALKMQLRRETNLC